MNTFPNANKEIKNIKIEIKELLNKLLDIDIEDINIENIEKSEKASTNNFGFIKIKGKLKNKKQILLFIKFIERGKIKETIFYYSDLLYKQVDKSEEHHKIKIYEHEVSSWKNKIILNLAENNVNTNKSMEIYIFILDKITDESIKAKIELLKKIYNLNDILSIGVKYI